MSDELLKTGAEVVFRLGDAICPEFEQIVNQMGPELAVRGEIALLSDRGDQPAGFAIVDVRGIHASLIVPVEKLSRSVPGVHTGESQIGLQRRMEWG